ncbi:hypothetical protein DFH06DRAFT_1156838 [Mycena polygramma]|nr:hypothetical protein DFH06DRAFT_1156838 [Mycena polygramma]
MTRLRPGQLAPANAAPATSHVSHARSVAWRHRAAMARIYRLPPARQNQALIPYRAQVPYDDEDDGVLYVNIQFADDDYTDYCAHHISLGDLLRRSNFKLGETKNLARRQSQYQRCDRGPYSHQWLLAFNVPKRLLGERVIQLAFDAVGGIRARKRCVCGRLHREYHRFASIGSWLRILTIIHHCLVLTGNTPYTVQRLS